MSDYDDLIKKLRVGYTHGDSGNVLEAVAAIEDLDHTLKLERIAYTRLMQEYQAHSEKLDREKAELQNSADAWKKLRELCGFWQDGSLTPVTLDQDDATRTCVLTVGGKSYYGHTFREAIDKATEGA